MRAFWRSAAVLLLGASVAGAGGVRSGDDTSGREQPQLLALNAGSPHDFDEISLESLLKARVVTASKHEQAFQEAPSSLTIVTAQEIAAHGYETLADVLRGAAGIYTSYDRNYDYIGVRGLSLPGDYNSRILLLVDGHSMNDNVWGMAGLGTEGALDLDLVDRIEIVRGPGSALYGTSAILAVVQIFTTKPGSRAGPEATAYAGSYGLEGGRIGWSGSLGKMADLLVSFSGMQSDGPDLYFPEFAGEGANGITRGTDYDRSNRAYATLISGPLRLSYVRSDRTKGIPTAAYDCVFGDPDTRTLDLLSFLEASYERSISEEFDFTLRGYADWYRYKGTWPTADPSDSTASEGARVLDYKDLSRGRWGGGEVRLGWKPHRAHHLTGGGEFRWNSALIRSWYDDPDSARSFSVLDLRQDSRFGALYLQEEFTPVAGVTATFGLHYDHYAIVGGSWTPRGGLVARIAPQTYLKLLYGEGFRAPSLGEIAYEDGVTILKNPDLRPERARTTETILEHSWRHRFWIRSSFYHMHVSDLILFTKRDDGWLQYLNSGKMHVDGAEIEARASMGMGIETKANASYARAVDRVAGRRAVNSPRWTAGGGITAPLLNNLLIAAFETRFVGDRRSGREGGASDAYLVAGANAAWKTPVRGLRLALKVSNLGDSPYSDPAGEEHVMDTIRQDGRTWLLSAKYSAPR